MKLFCKLPFTSISIDDNGDVWPSCCPDWVAFPMGNILKQSWDEIWFGSNATEFRNSMFDGSLRFCKKEWCPSISNALAGIDYYHVIPHKDSPQTWEGNQPIHVNLNYDWTCNLRCPSCRSDLIHYKDENLDRVMKIHSLVEEQIIPHVESIALTGVGDPFMSKVFRKFLTEFSSEKYPNIHHIHFHTNGLLFDERTYNKMKGIHHLSLSADISIDAASEKTYNILRPPGDWNTLIKNLHYIKQIPAMKDVGISMVVQQTNYHEIPDFIELGKMLVTDKNFVFTEFKRVRHYGHLTDRQFHDMDPIFLKNERKSDFQKILRLMEDIRLFNAANRILPAVRHNLHEYLVQCDSMQNSLFPIFNIQ